MKPVFKEAVWGGRKLRDDFGYEIPSDSTGSAGASEPTKMETVRSQKALIRESICQNCGKNIRNCLEMKMENMEKNFPFLLRSLMPNLT